MKRPGRVQYADEAVGALVLLALAAFFLAILQGGVLRAWFNPTATLRVVLPEQGLFGLAAGAPVEILGTKAGQIRRVVIDPGQSFYAEADIEDGMRTFIRRDSRAFIRKQFGIAGASYLEIGRGQGEPLDWSFAVVQAEVDRAPTENIGELIEDLRARVLPIIDQTGRAVTALAAFAEGMQSPDGDFRRMLASLQSTAGALQRGEGVVGRLLTDDRMVRDLEATMASANALVGQMRPILGELEKTAQNVSALSGAVRQQSEAIPGLVQSAGATADSLKLITADLSKTTPALPALLAQTQQATLELERLLLQVRSLWLLGGGGGGEAVAGTAPLPPLEVRP